MLTLLALGLNVQAQTISVDDIEALSEGETVQFRLHVSGVTAMTSMHFEVEMPDGFTVSGVSATTDWAAMFSREGGVVGAISSSDNALNGEGDAATVSVVTPNTAVGDYPVTISNIRINGTELGTTVNFKIKVVERHTVVLDENSTTVPEAAEGVNVLVKRTILANEWSSICLPFAMTAAQVKEAFGNDVLLGNFCDTESTYDGDENVVGISISFEDATEIEANHPYIIKVSSPITEFTVDNVDIDPAEDDALVEIDNGKTGKKRVVYGGFYGTYHAGTTLEEYALFLNSNKFWYSKGLTKMKAFRAYFVMLDVLTDVESAAARISFSFDNNESTGIREMKPSYNNKVIYDLQGRHITMPTKGLYIQNGMKRVIK